MRALTTVATSGDANYSAITTMTIMHWTTVLASDDRLSAGNIASTGCDDVHVSWRKFTRWWRHSSV